MYPMTILEWWHDGEWREIGWRAGTPESVADLRKHAEGLAAKGGGDYRLIRASAYHDGPPEVVWERRRSVARERISA